MKNHHIVKSVEPDSIAEECGFEPGDELISINGTEIQDIFDYRFLMQEEELTLLARSKTGEEVTLEIEKDSDEDLGLVFENEFMDSYRSCRNKCIFCFIDQMPKGMRETLYFKDDDVRLSFLQGNYITLTNLDDEDMERIIKYRPEPVNISFHTMNPELRCKMLNNRFAGDALKKADRIYEEGLTMNGQIVLCKGVNDGKELEYTLEKLYEYVPLLESLSIVPVGLTKFREGLYPLEPFCREDAIEVIILVEKWQKKAWQEYKTHYVHASDEWYLLAGREMPGEETYDGYLQLENGVGMSRLFEEDFKETLQEIKEACADSLQEKEGVCREFLSKYRPKYKRVSMVTGTLAFPLIKRSAEKLEELCPELKIQVFEIRNDYFGERITVTGLITATDIIAQLKGRELGDCLLIPDCMLKADEDVFLDDISLTGLGRALQVKTDIVKSSGRDFIFAVLEK